MPIAENILGSIKEITMSDLLKSRHGVLFMSFSRNAHKLIDVPEQHKKVFYCPKQEGFSFSESEYDSLEHFFAPDGDFVNTFRSCSKNNEEAYFIL